jgi:16S rRNA C967 or C1407 C5-methylase (RsmB/RsmF family)
MPIDEFDDFYAKIWGVRWTSLRESLLRKRPGYHRANRFQRLQVDLAPIYEMDGASMICAAALGVKPGMHVLDLCAAPGGKSLVLAEALASGLEKPSLQGPVPNLEGELTLNELSLDRFHRLRRVLADYLPKQIVSQIRFTRRPGEVFFKGAAGAFDRILLDTPCSSEGHLLQSPLDLEKWTPARPRSLTKKQYALLCSAAECLKEGGRLIYSTCSINPMENDQVVESFLERSHRKDLGFRLVPPSALVWNSEMDTENPDPSSGEVTACGVWYLPDKSPWGPIYYAMIERI